MHISQDTTVASEQRGQTNSGVAFELNSDIKIGKYGCLGQSNTFYSRILAFPIRRKLRCI